jgi:chromosome partitioning protein
VLVIDTDPQANASHVLLGGQPARRPTLHEVLVGQGGTSDAIVPSVLDGVDVLPADASLADVNVILAGEVGRERRLRVALEDLGDGAYDFALVDTAPTRSLLTTNVLNAVAEVLVPISPGLFGVLGLGQLQTDISTVRRYLDNKALRLAGVILTMAEKNNVSRDLEYQLRELFGPLVFRTVIPRSIKLEEAHSRHESIFTYAPKSVGAVAYRALTEEILAHGRAQDGPDRAGGDPPADRAGADAA